jgi:hypothetical protein
MPRLAPASPRHAARRRDAAAGRAQAMAGRPPATAGRLRSTPARSRRCAREEPAADRRRSRFRANSSAAPPSPASQTGRGEVARGLVNYGSSDARRLPGAPARHRSPILGYIDEPEIIHRDNLILVKRLRAGETSDNRFIVPRQQFERECREAGFAIVGHVDFLPYLFMWRAYVLRKSCRPEIVLARPAAVHQSMNVRDLFPSAAARSELQHHQLAGFGPLWSLATDWHEAPNERRGGWSGVSRHLLADGSAIFVKRQEDHLCRTLRHPLRGIPTFYREYRNILRLHRHAIGTLEALYYGDRRDAGQGGQARSS